MGFSMVVCVYAMVSDIKKAIKLIRGVVSVKVIKPKVVK